MSTITAFESVSVDGVMQGLARPDEDTRGGFAHGGWGLGYDDEVLGRFAGEEMARKGALLFGRRTYEDLMRVWTSRDDGNPYTDALVRNQKYVCSSSPDTVLGYESSTLLAGDAVTEVAALKERLEDPLMILGSGLLTRALHAAGLVDEYTLLVHPIVLGSGTRLFGAGERVDLELVQCLPTTTGVVIAQYAVRH